MNPLEGAEFTLTRDGADLGTYSTAPGGTVTLPMLTTGTYILTETVSLGTDGADLLEGGGRDHHRYTPRRVRDLLLETHRQRRRVYADRYQCH